MKGIIYSKHAEKRRRQRGISKIDIQYVLENPNYIKKSFDNRKEAVGTVKNRTIKVIYRDADKFIKIITII